jgi:hypothetical protein
MAKHINSVYRIHALISNIPSPPENTQVVEVWAQLFKLDSLSPNKKASAVTDRLSWVLRELELSYEQLKNTGHSESLYQDAITHLEHAFSPMLLPNQWPNVRQYLTQETLKTLAIYSETLPDEEVLITDDDLNELHTRVAELETFLENSTLPNRLLELIKHHLSLIKQALEEYPIAGAKALIKARQAAFGEIFEAQDIFKENRDCPEIKKLGGLLES